MATKTIYVLGSAAAAPNYWGNLQDGGTAPTAALATFGWTVAKIASPSFWRARLGASAAGTVSQATSAIDGASGPQKGTGATSTTAGDSFVSPAAYSGYFAPGTWTFNWGLRGTATAVGRIRMRVWASANADGSAALELTSGALVGSTVTISASNVTYNSSISWTAPAITLKGEFLFFQVEWNETTAGTAANSGAMFYVSAATIATTDYEPTQTLAPAVAGDAEPVFSAAALAITPLSAFSHLDAEAFPAPTAQPGAWALSPLLMVDIDGAAVSAAAYSLNPPLADDADAVAGPSSLQTVVLQNTTYGEYSDFYPPGITLFLVPELAADAETANGGDAAVGLVSLGPAAVDPDDWFLVQEAVGHVDLAPAFYMDRIGLAPGGVGDRFYQPSAQLLTQYAAPDSFDDTDDIVAPFGTDYYGVLAPFEVCLDHGYVYAPTLTPGEVTLVSADSNGVDADEVLSPQGEAGAELVANDCIADPDLAYGAADVAAGDVEATASIVTDDDTVEWPELVAGDAAGKPDDVLSDDDAHHGFSIVAGDAGIGAYPYADLDAVLKPSVVPATDAIGSAHFVDRDFLSRPVLTGGSRPWLLAPLKGAINDPGYMRGRVGKAPPRLVGSIGRAA